MRILALDIGETRTGIAVSDPDERIATPLCVLPTNEVFACSSAFQNVLEDWQPGLLLFGLPYTLNGKEGSQADKTKQSALRIASSCGLEAVYADERLSSEEAKRSLRDQGYNERAMRGKIDMVAASLFLQAWLDGRVKNDCER